MSTNYNVVNKTILITGANRGIGKALVESFVNAGAAKVYAAVRNVDSATSLTEIYGSDKIVPIQVDLSKPETIQKAAQQATDVDIVVNNAGVLTINSPLSENAVDSLSHELDVNLYGLIHMAQAFGPLLKNNKGGVFVQLNSVASMKSFGNFATYSASKAAAYSVTQALREMWKDQGTLVLSVHPGPIATDMADQAGFDGEPASTVSDAVVESIRKGEFHVFPDTMAKQVGGAYESFAKNVVEAQTAEA